MLARLIRTGASSLSPLTAAIGLTRRTPSLGRYGVLIRELLDVHFLVQCVVPLESSRFALCCVQVTGDSIFNLLALADVETDKDDRPVYPQKILSVEVPFLSCNILLLFPFWYLPLCFIR